MSSGFLANVAKLFLTLLVMQKVRFDPMTLVPKLYLVAMQKLETALIHQAVNVSFHMNSFELNFQKNTMAIILFKTR